jgi:hypothetical protein
MELLFYSFVTYCLGVYAKICGWKVGVLMSGRFVAGLIVGAMIMGPYRITADQKKVEVTKVAATKEEPKSDLKKATPRLK